MKNLWIIATLLLASAAAADEHANCPMHAAHMKHVAHRGDGVMGFSHEKTKHSFKPAADGGSIEVRALDASDATSLAAIRTHLQTIAKDFAAGNFAKPEEIHATLPDGADVMAARKALIKYDYEEIENGARVRITTKDPAALEAVHRFLKFQVEEHGE